MKKLFILDAIAYLFRSFYAIRGMTTPSGEPTNALYGFMRSVQKIIKEFSPDYIVAVFDGPNNKASRTAIYESYKSHREEMPEGLYSQLGRAHEYCEAAGIPMLSVPGVEADDTIGTITKWAESQNLETYICSSDKDLCQLVNDKTFLLNTGKGNLLIDRDKVKELYGIYPEQVVDYLSITGDASDGIPGIPSFGAKTAGALLEKYETLDYILAHPDEVTTPKKAETIRENKELALISRKLATLDLTVDIPRDETFYTIKDLPSETLHNFYKELNFTTLLKESGGAHAPTEKKGAYHLVDDEKSLDDLIRKLSSAKEVCVDTETTTLNTLDAQIVGLGFCIEKGDAYYVPTNGKLGQDFVFQKLKPLLESDTIAWIGHNIKYDMHALANHGIALKKIASDTMVASYILRPDRTRHSLDALTLELFDHRMTSIKTLIGTGKKQISMLDVPLPQVSDYCCEDVDYTLQLKHQFDNELEASGLKNVYRDLELPLIPILFHMERTGIHVNRAALTDLSKVLTREIDRTKLKIFEAASETFNLNSPKQLSHILYTKLGIPPQKNTKGKLTHLSTSADILTSLKNDYPICGDILTYRGLEKLRSTYVDTLPTQINEKTGRIHCSFNQAGTATGRLSCQDPNLQNIPVRSPEGKKIREAFTPEKPDSSFLAADYSQIELRLMAVFSNEEKLITAFKNGEDIHASTATNVFQVPLDEVTPDMRWRAKAVNFGIMYGQQAFGLAGQLGISVSDASAFIKKYFEHYPNVQKFIETCKENGRKNGYVETIFGRRRPLSDITSNNSIVRSAAERLAVNTPLQGSQADIIKKAMEQIDTRLSGLEAKMILQIHDELIFEVPDEEIPTLKTLVKEEMEGVTNLSVPLSVDIEIGKNWSQC